MTALYFSFVTDTYPQKKIKILHRQTSVVMVAHPPQQQWLWGSKGEPSVCDTYQQWSGKPMLNWAVETTQKNSRFMIHRMC